MTEGFCSLPAVDVSVEFDAVTVSEAVPEEGKRREMAALISVEQRKSLGEFCVCRTTSGQVGGGPAWR